MFSNLRYVFYVKQFTLCNLRYLMAHKKHQSPQSYNPQVRPHAESVDRPVDWSASRILRVPIRDWRPFKVGVASGPNYPMFYIF